MEYWVLAIEPLFVDNVIALAKHFTITSVDGCVCACMYVHVCAYVHNGISSNDICCEIVGLTLESDIVRHLTVLC